MGAALPWTNDSCCRGYVFQPCQVRSRRVVRGRGGGIPQISNHLTQSLVPESTSWALLLTEISSGMNPLLEQITKLKCLWEHTFHFSKAPRPPWKEKFHLIQCPPDALEIFCQCFYTCVWGSFVYSAQSPGQGFEWSVKGMK
jgi:hypothetical protein